MVNALPVSGVVEEAILAFFALHGLFTDVDLLHNLHTLLVLCALLLELQKGHKNGRSSTVFFFPQLLRCPLYKTQ